MDVFEKFNIITKNNERLYIEDLSIRDYTLEGSTPVSMKIGDERISARAWGKLLFKITEYLQKHHPKTKEELLDFRTEWSKACPFSLEKKSNFQPFLDDIYINLNHTALHSVWLIQDLLNFFGENIEDCTLLIKRPPTIEPEEVRAFVIETMKRKFSFYLTERKMSDDQVAVVLRNMDYINSVLAKTAFGKTYFNFYLLDTPQYVSNIKSKFLKEVPFSNGWSEKKQAIAQRTLDRYTSFCGQYFKD